MKAHVLPRQAIAAAAACLALAACDTSTRNAGNRDGATVGQKVDQALAQTKEELSRAGDSIERGAKQMKPTLERAGDSIERGAKQVKPALERAGDKVMRAGGSDAAITASIKADYLKAPDLSVFQIDVDTSEGIVTLNGVTESAAARERAAKLAAANKGVKEVRNRLTIKQG